eukprot:TRINITY_DN3099_c0_g1_i1.p4 TRINITY_DN3099_c0_g1~~TRINITY_DN3099_c0_g1_i1.p4  ORF type:complete len:116 (+),score=14.50 TRINITY_DN3099_c0_g1_i1:67-414(+)
MSDVWCIFFFFFSSRRRHTRCREVSWARRCVQETDQWSARRDSNPQLPPWQGGTLPLSHSRILVQMKGVEPPRRRRQILSLVRLPIPPHLHLGGSPGNRTRDTMIKSHVLYQLSQ